MNFSCRWWHLSDLNGSWVTVIYGDEWWWTIVAYETWSWMYFDNIKFVGLDMKKRVHFLVNFVIMCATFNDKKFLFKLKFLFPTPKFYDILEWCVLCINCNVQSLIGTQIILNLYKTWSFNWYSWKSSFSTMHIDFFRTTQMCVNIRQCV